MDPIEPHYIGLMRDVGKILDDTLNHGKKSKQHGFVLFMFDFGTDKRLNYISNAEREDMLATLKEFIAHVEGRTIDEVGHG